MKKRSKLIRVNDLNARKHRETAEMVAELEQGVVKPRWPMRFRATGDKKLAPRAVKKPRKLIRVSDLEAGKHRETAEMVAELEQGMVKSRGPVRFRAMCEKKKAPRRR